MDITRDIIMDLLPIYLAGEASPGTRHLIEQYLRDHPSFATEIRATAERTASLLRPAAETLPPDHERATFERVRRFNRYRTWILGLAIAYSLVPFTFVFGNGAIQWLMVRDNPKQAIFFWVAAAGCWAAHHIMGRRLRVNAG